MLLVDSAVNFGKQNLWGRFYIFEELLAYFGAQSSVLIASFLSCLFKIFAGHSLEKICFLLLS